MYGLKQAARCWFKKLEKILREKGYEPMHLHLDKKDIFRNIYIVLYVNNLVIAIANIQTMNSFKYNLTNKFSMADLKEIKLFLVLRIESSKESITLV